MFVPILLSFCINTPVFCAQKAPREEPKKHVVASPLWYKDLMLVVTNENGVAAIVFTKEVEKGVVYKYRFLDHRSRKEEKGNDYVCDKFKLIPSKDADKLDFVQGEIRAQIKARKVELDWSYSKPGRGWIYHDPDALRVFFLSSEEFESIELARFLKK